MSNKVNIRSIDGALLGEITESQVSDTLIARFIPYPANLALSKEQLEKLSMKPDQMILMERTSIS